MMDDQEKLRRIRALVVGIGRTKRPHNGMDMLADAVLSILDNDRPKTQGPQ